MKRSQKIIGVLVLFITFCIILSGCSVSAKSGIDDGNSVETSESDVISNPNSPTPELVSPTTTSSPSDPTLSPTNTPTNSPTIAPTINPTEVLPQDSLAMEAYKAVLLNNNTFYSADNKKDIFLKDLLSAGGSGYDAELEVKHFTTIDLDGDTAPEAVLELSVVGNEWPDFYEVLHYMNDKVYGYFLVLRGFEELKADGTFMYSNGAADWGYAKLKLTSDSYEYEELGYCESSTDGELYFINDKPSTEASFTTFANEQNVKEAALWYEFSQENIEAELSKY